MKINKKMLWGLLIVIFAALIPYFTGHYIEIKYYDFSERMSEFKGVELNPISYERHWGRSTAKTRVLLTQPAYVQLSRGLNATKLSIDKLPDLSFVLEHEIHHGPVIKHNNKWQVARTIIDSKLYLSDEAKQTIETELGTADLINIISDMDLLSGLIRIQLEGASFRTREQEANEPDAWGGIRGRWELNASLSSIKGELICPSFNLDIYDANYLGKDLFFSTERERIHNGLWQGKGQLQLQSLNIEDPEDDLSLNAEGTIASGSMQQDGNLVSSTGYVRMERLEDKTTALGPINFQVSVNRIPNDIFALVNHLVQQTESLDQIPVKLYQSTDFLASLPRLLEARPEVIINNVLINSKEGALAGELMMTIGGKGAHNVLNPEQVLKSAIVKAEFRIPKTMLYQSMRQHDQIQKELGRIPESQDFESTYKAWLSKWVGGGYLMDVGEYYQTKVDFENGILKINGAVVPLD